MNKTLIEWALNPDGTPGYTWNPITGCLNHTPEGLCLGGMFPCYAYKLANGRLRRRYLANENFARPNIDRYKNPLIDPFYPRFWPERLAELERGIDSPDYQNYIRQKAKGIFVCDMGELFGSWLPDEWIAKVLETIADDSNSMHRFYLLTKQPQNLLRWSPFPDNCWVGVTATNPDMAMEAISRLLGIQAKIKYLSIEPLLFDKAMGGIEWRDVLFSVIDWLIIGAQTKPYKPPKIEHVEEIVRIADKANVPVFLKNNLKIAFNTLPYEDNKWFWSSYGQLRQELPKEK